jgi:hypothetical protein
LHEESGPGLLVVLWDWKNVVERLNEAEMNDLSTYNKVDITTLFGSTFSLLAPCSDASGSKCKTYFRSHVLYQADCYLVFLNIRRKYVLQLCRRSPPPLARATLLCTGGLFSQYEINVRGMTWWLGACYKSNIIVADLLLPARNQQKKSVLAVSTTG